MMNIQKMKSTFRNGHASAHLSEPVTALKGDHKPVKEFFGHLSVSHQHMFKTSETPGDLKFQKQI